MDHALLPVLRRSMPLPDFDRAIYQKNPLIGVAFQAKFPRFLTIETEQPAPFQKLIMGDYPIYEQQNVVQIILASGAQDGAQQPAEVQGRMHVFRSTDKVWSLSLGSDQILLSTRVYSHWGEFKDRLKILLDAFFEFYRPPMFIRISLRYQNLIRPWELGLDGHRWKDLLQPYIAGELASGLQDAEIVSRQTVTTIKLSDNNMLLLRHGLVTHKETQKPAFLIDGDFYNDKQRTADLEGTLDVTEQLHTDAERVFRWSITEAVHDAMGPGPAR
jgi:uncharacterized protein (TIGR04255 family)